MALVRTEVKCGLSCISSNETCKIKYKQRSVAQNSRTLLLNFKGPEMPKEANSLITKASEEKWSLWTFNRGLTTFVDALEDKLIDSGVTILKDVHVTSLKVNENKEIHVNVDQSGKIFVADHVISCIPSKKLAELLPNEHAILAGFLHNIHAVTVAVVNLEFEGSILEMEGFGYLYPSRESQKVLGVIFDSSTFSEGDRKSSESTRLTVSIPCRIMFACKNENV